MIFQKAYEILDLIHKNIKCSACHDQYSFVDRKIRTVLGFIGIDPNNQTLNTKADEVCIQRRLKLLRYYWVNDQWKKLWNNTNKGKPKDLKKNITFSLAHHKSHMDCSGTESEHPHWQGGDRPLSHGKALSIVMIIMIICPVLKVVPR
jgi:hypothetical protein